MVELIILCSIIIYCPIQTIVLEYRGTAHELVILEISAFVHIMMITTESRTVK
jgi:hypothetical protein